MSSDVLDSVPSRVQEMKIIVEALKETHRHIEALLQAGFTTTAEKTQQRADTLVNALMGNWEIE